jgi:hypothetical protein
MVIEHTVVESFHKRIFDDRLFVALAAEIERRLVNELPVPGNYRVVFQSGEIRRRQDVDGIVDEAVVWGERDCANVGNRRPENRAGPYCQGGPCPLGAKNPPRTLAWS